MQLDFIVFAIVALVAAAYLWSSCDKDAPAPLPVCKANQYYCPQPRPMFAGGPLESNRLAAAIAPKLLSNRIDVEEENLYNRSAYYTRYPFESMQFKSSFGHTNID